MNRVLVYGLKEPLGGVEKVVLEYVRHIIQTGEDITFDFIQFKEGFSLENELCSMGCKVLYVPSKKDSYAQYKKAMSKIFDDNIYTAVWGNFSGLTNIDILVLAKKHKIPVRIAHSHVAKLYWGSTIIKYIGTVLHSFNKKRLDRFATHFWSCSPLAGKFMFPSKVHNKITVVNNAVDTDVFCPDAEKRNEIRKELGIKQDEKVVGHVARMCAAKNQVFLLEVMLEVLKLQPEAKLLFVGDGELKQNIVDKAKMLNISESVIFTGTRNDIADLLCAMDVFVLPSFSEGLGLSAIEAQACAVPCVVSDAVPKAVDVSGCVEFVSLEKSASQWAQIVLQQSDKKIEDPAIKIRKSGYDIKAEAVKIYSIFKEKTV